MKEKHIQSGSKELEELTEVISLLEATFGRLALLMERSSQNIHQQKDNEYQRLELQLENAYLHRKIHRLAHFFLQLVLVPDSEYARLLSEYLLRNEEDLKKLQENFPNHDIQAWLKLFP